ncbi:contactin-1 isoform X2 [Tribolium castaneum]|uniref:Contactin-3-like Protein n=1 Tax=Tribolium castaneum TaxID=7070 RepID=D6WG58_TRICA|nr:PREDICTED: contactin-1 isoform X2 [Tribolium castaneum]EFA00199.2 Contactin-3-like Protein [Tribolium castaneum]|eukprot:XP_008190804.1 PREDICTED: contactin-1 isoform X2 [Tribolium castaneum]
MCIKGVPFLCLLLCLVVVKGAKISEFGVDVGRNLTLPCPIQDTKDVMWVREEREDHQISHMQIINNGSLFLSSVEKSDAGIYACYKANSVDDEKARMKVVVKTPPPALGNVSVRPSSIIALILWEVNGTGGYPIINFTAQYRLAGSEGEWLPISPNHITPNSRQIDVYKLQPNTSYEFRIWATNKLGRGEITTVIGTTSHEYREEELARRMLAGADKFDTRVWAVAVGIVMGTLILLGLGTCFLLYQECRLPSVPEEQEIIELVPNIILNPGFEGNLQSEQMPADENSNNETPLRLNNNTVVQPRNV